MFWFTSGVEQVVKKFGRVDILINNASALWWQDMTDTPVKRYDLITTINARGTSDSTIPAKQFLL